MNGKPNPANKTMGWLKGVLANRNEIDQDFSPMEGPESPDGSFAAEVPRNTEAPTELAFPDSSQDKAPLSRESHDKLSLDLIVAVENIMSDRQLIIFKNKGLEDQLHHANETISHLKMDVNKKEHALLAKEKEIRILEDKLTGKQMSYDQLLEDYKEYQNAANNSTDALKYQLDKERTKYQKLDEEFTKHQSANMQQVKALEEKQRDLEAENQQLIEQSQKILEEKNQLLQTINDFTERMSISFSHSDKTKPAAPLGSSD